MNEKKPDFTEIVSGSWGFVETEGDGLRIISGDPEDGPGLISRSEVIALRDALTEWIGDGEEVIRSLMVRGGIIRIDLTPASVETTRIALADVAAVSFPEKPLDGEFIGNMDLRSREDAERAARFIANGGLTSLGPSDDGQSYLREGGSHERKRYGGSTS